MCGHEEIFPGGFVLSEKEWYSQFSLAYEGVWLSMSLNGNSNILESSFLFVKEIMYGIEIVYDIETIECKLNWLNGDFN